MAFADKFDLDADQVAVQKILVPPGGVWRVPGVRNSFFTGRQTALRELRRRFEQRKPEQKVQAIVGLGGVGKTQLATEYAWRFREKYDIVWWLPADDATTMALSFAQLAKRLGLRFQEPINLELVRHALRRSLGEASNWLLIFDNAASVAAIENYLPTQRTGDVLITSRDTEWRGIAALSPLRSMEREESIEFLVRRVGRRQDDAVVRRVAQALGDYPLALEQAGAHVVETRIDYAAYLKRFESHWAELLARGVTHAAPGAEYPDSLAMSLELTFRQLEEDEPAAQSLLNLLSFFSGESLPASLFDAINSNSELLPANLIGAVSDTETRNYVLSVLSRFSLIDGVDGAGGEAGTLHIHRLVAALCRGRLSTVDQSELAMIAVRSVMHAFPFDSQDPRTWPVSEAVLPHALAVADHVVDLGVEQESAARLLNSAGQLMMKQGRLPEARDTLEKALNLARSIHGPLHPRLAAMSNDLGRVMQKLGDSVGAREHFEASMHIDQNIYGENESHAASVVNNYAMTLHGDGDLQAAREHFERALVATEREYGPNHRRVATIRNNLACVLRDSGDVEAARTLFKLALEAARTSSGDSHPLVARIAFNFGSMLRVAGAIAESRSLLELALRIDRQTFGDSHPDVKRDLTELAAIARSVGDSATAVRLENAAQAIPASNESGVFRPGVAALAATDGG